MGLLSIELKTEEVTQMVCDKVSAEQGWPLGCLVQTKFLIENGQVIGATVTKLKDKPSGHEPLGRVA